MDKAIKDYMNYWRHALDTNGEVDRSEYWLPTLTHVAVFTILVLADIENFEVEPGEQMKSTALNKLYIGLTLMTFVPSYTLFSRRLNKLGLNKNIAKATYMVNVLGYLWVVGMSKTTQEEMNARFGAKNFMMLAVLLGITFLTEVTIAAKQDK